MEKEFVQYSHALALKELGFHEPCLCSFYQDQSLASEARWVDYNTSETLISAPLYQQAFDWFEEKYGLCLSRRVTCSMTSVTDIIFTVNSINGNWMVNFVEPYSAFDVYKAKNICLDKLIALMHKRNMYADI